MKHRNCNLGVHGVEAHEHQEFSEIPLQTWKFQNNNQEPKKGIDSRTSSPDFYSANHKSFLWTRPWAQNKNTLGIKCSFATSQCSPKVKNEGNKQGYEILPFPLTLCSPPDTKIPFLAVKNSYSPMLLLEARSKGENVWMEDLKNNYLFSCKTPCAI